MKHEKTRVRPAQTIDASTYTCDVPGCSEPASWDPRFRSCFMCKGDVCATHRVYDSRDDSGPMFCVTCWAIGEPYRKKIRDAEAVSDAVYVQWKAACKEPSK